MADPRRSDGFLVLLYSLLLIVGIVLIAQGVLAYLRAGDTTLLGLGVVAVIVPASLYPIAAAMRDARVWAATRDEQAREMTRLLQSINSGVSISDVAERIAFRHQDRAAMRNAIQDDNQRRDYDAALVLVTEMGAAFGKREEAEEYREEILRARSEEIEKKVDEA